MFLVSVFESVKKNLKQLVRHWDLSGSKMSTFLLPGVENNILVPNIDISPCQAVHLAHPPYGLFNELAPQAVGHDRLSPSSSLFLPSIHPQAEPTFPIFSACSVEMTRGKMKISLSA
jgi:hypothetical protein